jgi:hypothetical protein
MAKRKKNVVKRKKIFSPKARVKIESPLTLHCFLEFLIH